MRRHVRLRMRLELRLFQLCFNFGDDVLLNSFVSRSGATFLFLSEERGNFSFSVGRTHRVSYPVVEGFNGTLAAVVQVASNRYKFAGLVTPWITMYPRCTLVSSVVVF